jgi:hypothetical protein
MAVALACPTAPDYFGISVCGDSSRYYFDCNKWNVSTFSGSPALERMGAGEDSLSVLTKALFDRLVPFFTIIKGETSTVTVPAAEKISTVLTFYSLGKTHLSSIAAVSRPALYAWIDGSSEPDAQNFHKIDALYRIAKDIDPALQNCLFRGFVERPLAGFSQSLFDVFVRNDILDTPAVRAQVKNAFDKSVERAQNIAQRRQAAFRIPHSAAEQDLTLEDNLLDSNA